MGSSRIVLGVLASALLATTTLSHAAPAQAESASYSGWTHREDARPPGTDRTDTRPGSSLRLYHPDDQVSIVSDASADQPDLGPTGIEFLPPAGQTLQAGQTYAVGGVFRKPTSTRGQVLVFRNGTMCGRTPDELSAGGNFSGPPADGWFHVDDIEYVDGVPVSFAATYEISCQYFDGPAGYEGTIAVKAPQPPKPIPDAPTIPGPITGLTAYNTDPDGGGTNTTTLSWTNPAGYGDVNIDMVQSANSSAFPAVLGEHSAQQWRGRASSYHDGHVEFMDVRTYRVVARGTTGRLGAPSLLTVMGSRLNVPESTQTIMIGERATYSGRLTMALGVDSPPGQDPMSGPPLADRTVVMCQQSTARPVDHGCNPVDSTKTSADGSFTLSVTPVANSWYSVMLPSSPDLIGNRSFVLTTGVAPQTDLRGPSDTAGRLVAGTMRATVQTVRRGSAIHFTTSRARLGSLGVVRLQHLSGGTWRTIVTKRLGRRTARLGLKVRERSQGLHSFRVVKPGDSHHVNGLSRVVQIRVS